MRQIFSILATILITSSVAAAQPQMIEIPTLCFDRAHLLKELEEREFVLSFAYEVDGAKATISGEIWYSPEPNVVAVVHTAELQDRELSCLVAEGLDFRSILK